MFDKIEYKVINKGWGRKAQFDSMFFSRDFLGAVWMKKTERGRMAIDSTIFFYQVVDQEGIDW